MDYIETKPETKLLEKTLKDLSEKNIPENHDLFLKNMEKDISSFHSNVFLLDPLLKNNLKSFVLSFTDIHKETPLKASLYSKTLYFLIKTRGVFDIMKHFPLSPENLNIFQMIRKTDNIYWETKYIFLLWFSFLINLPFPFPKMAIQIETTKEDLYQTIIDYIKQPGKVCEAAIKVLSNLISKTDCEDLFQDFLLKKHINFVSLSVLYYFLKKKGEIKEIDSSKINNYVSEFREESKIKMKTQSEMVLSLQLTKENRNSLFSSVLLCLHSNQTEIRWSAAKRIVNIIKERREYLSTVLFIIQTTNEKKESIDTIKFWDGSLLLLGRLIKESIPLKHIPFELVLKGLWFRSRNGKSYIGANVRDTSCYVSWVLARSSLLTEKITKEIVQKLIPSCLFDREVSCRRSAAAALQEIVGRTKFIKEGEGLIEKINFFSVSSLQKTYRKISKTIFILEEYKKALIDYLFNYSVFSVFQEIREEASLCLKSFSLIDKTIFKEKLSLLKEQSKGIDPFSIHGSLLTASVLCNDFSSVCIEIFQDHSDLSKYKFGLDLILDGLCKLANGLFYSNNINKELLPQTVQLLFSIAQSKDISLQRKSSIQLTLNIISLLEEKEAIEFTKKVCLFCIKGKKTYERRGYCFILGELPVYNKTLDLIIETSKKAFLLGYEGKKALSVFGRLIKRIIIKHGTYKAIPLISVLNELMSDYTIDHTGDAGAILRLESMLSFTSFILDINVEQAKTEIIKYIQSLVCIFFGRLFALKEKAKECVFILMQKKDLDLNIKECFLNINNEELFVKKLLSLSYLGDTVVLSICYLYGSIDYETNQKGEKLLISIYSNEKFTKYFVSCFKKNISNKRFIYSLLKSLKLILSEKTIEEIKEPFCDYFSNITKTLSIQTIKISIECAFLIRKEENSILENGLEKCLSFNYPNITNFIKNLKEKRF